MKIPVEINGKSVTIELTPEQIALVKKSTEKITDRIKTFADVLEAIGKKRTQAFEKACENCNEHTVADMQLQLICEVLNEGWIAEPFNTSQYKYYPYFEVKGSAFVYDYYYIWLQSTSVGSRLCFKNSDLAIYAAKQFIDIYNKYLS